MNFAARIRKSNEIRKRVPENKQREAKLNELYRNVQVGLYTGKELLGREYQVGQGQDYLIRIKYSDTWSDSGKTTSVEGWGVSPDMAWVQALNMTEEV
jgi:hypothetical protein